MRLTSSDPSDLSDTLFTYPSLEEFGWNDFALGGPWWLRCIDTFFYSTDIIATLLLIYVPLHILYVHVRFPDHPADIKTQPRAAGLAVLSFVLVACVTVLFPIGSWVLRTFALFAFVACFGLFFGDTCWLSPANRRLKMAKLNASGRLHSKVLLALWQRTAPFESQSQRMIKYSLPYLGLTLIVVYTRGAFEVATWLVGLLGINMVASQMHMYAMSQGIAATAIEAANVEAKAKETKQVEDEVAGEIA